jgi:hypothetical protein
MADPNLRFLTDGDKGTKDEPKAESEATRGNAALSEVDGKRSSEIEHHTAEFKGQVDGLASHLHELIETMRKSGNLGRYEEEVNELKATSRLNARADSLIQRLREGIASGSGKPPGWDGEMAKLTGEFADTVSRSHAASPSRSDAWPTSGSGQKETTESNDQLGVLHQKVKNAQKIADGALVRRAMESVVSSAEKGNYICVLDANCGPDALGDVRRVIEYALKDHGIRIDECKHLNVPGTIPYARIHLSW